MTDMPTENQLRQLTFVGDRERALYGRSYSQLDCSHCRKIYAAALAAVCANARQCPSLASLDLDDQFDLADGLEPALEAPIHFARLAEKFSLQERDDCDVLEVCYRWHLVRVVVEMDRGRLVDLGRACEIAQDLGELSGPCLVEALLLDGRFSGYSSDEVMNFATTAIGGGIVPADFSAAK
jgi:hypothetical protein